MPFSVEANQKRFRFRKDVGTGDAAASWLAAEDTDIEWQVDQKFRLRIGLQEFTGNFVGSNIVPDLKYRKNGGSWNNVNATSSNVRTVDGTRADGSNCATHHMTLTGTHRGNNGYDDVNGVAGTGTLNPNGHYECEFVIELRGEHVNPGDVLEFRVEEPLIITKWDAIPALTVVAMSGSAIVRASGDGVATGAGALRGSAESRFSTAAGPPQGVGRLSGIASISVTASALMRAIGNLMGASATAFTFDATSAAPSMQAVIRILDRAGISISVVETSSVGSQCVTEDELGNLLERSGVADRIRDVVTLGNVLDESQAGSRQVDESEAGSVQLDPSPVGNVLDAAEVSDLETDRSQLGGQVLDESAVGTADGENKA